MIKEEFDLSDFQSGFLLTAFTIFCMITSPLFGHLADKGVPRKYLIVLGVVLWSLATCSTALSVNYITLLIPRMVVGVGEGSYNAVSGSLLSDYFPARKRNLAFAVFCSAIPIGSAIGYLLGGYLGDHIGWRYAFLFTGLPGLLSAVFLCIDEPTPGSMDPDGVTMESPGIRDAVRMIMANRTYLLAVGGLAATTFGIGGLADWLPVFLSRYYLLTASQAGFVVGAIAATGGLVGTILGGLSAEKLRRFTRQPYFAISCWSMALATGLCIISFYAFPVNVTPLEVVMFPAMILAWISNGPINAAIMNSFPANMRARASAVCILCIHLLGDAISPAIIGAVSDATDGLASVIWGFGWRLLPLEGLDEGYIRIPDEKTPLHKIVENVELERKSEDVF